jgi:hypothetical protein
MTTTMMVVLLAATKTLFHYTQAYPVVVPLATGLAYAGLGMLDLYPHLRRWLGMAAIVAAVELCIALVISRHWFFVVALPVGVLALVGYAIALLRGGGSEYKATPANEQAELRRTGYRGHKGSRADLSEASFSDRLDVGIDNAGEVDAKRARFGVPAEPDRPDDERERS